MEMQEKTTTKKVSNTLNLYDKIVAMRCDLQDAKIKKGGKNEFAHFTYYTLDDLLPNINKLEKQYKVFSNFSLTNDLGILTLINTEKPDEQVVFTSPVADAQIKGTTPIQSLGGVHTYLKRYLYLNAFEIAEPDTLDALVGTDKIVEKTYKATAPQTPPYNTEYGVPNGQTIIVDSEGWFDVSYTDFKNNYNTADYEKGKYDATTRTIKVRRVNA